MQATHRERINAAINGSSIIDRPPVALWRHFPVDDQSPGSLASVTLAYQSYFDWDLLKVTPASSYCLKDWGATDTWEGNTEGTRRITNFVVKKPQDWKILRVLDPRKTKYLGAQLQCLQIIRASLSPEIPVLQTIFSPLAQAKNLVGKSNLLHHINTYPEAVESGLRVIAETTQRFIEILSGMNIDGIYYAIQHAQKCEMPYETYINFGYRFDEISLAPVNNMWCNLLHLHGNDIYFDLAAKLSSTFQIVNWHDRETSPSVSEGQKIFPGCICGGVSQNTLVYENSERVIEESKDAFSKSGNKRFILGTGCVVPIISPVGNIMAIRNALVDL